jgi:hypothetical protein
VIGSHDAPASVFERWKASHTTTRRAGRRALLGAGDRGEGSRPRPKGARGRGLREIGEEVEVDNAVVIVEDLLVELDRLDDAPLAVPQRDGVHLHRLAGQRRERAAGKSLAVEGDRRQRLRLARDPRRRLKELGTVLDAGDQIEALRHGCQSTAPQALDELDERLDVDRAGLAPHRVEALVDLLLGGNRLSEPSEDDGVHRERGVGLGLGPPFVATSLGRQGAVPDGDDVHVAMFRRTRRG